jgi:hypothetical protein
MRPYRLVDDDFDDESYPRVIPISSAPRARAQAAERASTQRQPWMPRELDVIPLARPPDAPPPAPSRRRRRFLTTTQQIMLAVFAAVCIGMVLAMVAWRISVPSPAGPGSTAAGPEQLPAEPTAVELASEGREPGTGRVESHRQVIQANYSVAPGDTLGSIASRHNTSVEALASLNNLENRNSLRVGQRLIIP